MSEGRRRLVALPGAPERASAPGRRPPSRAIPLLVAVALACAVGWAVAQQRSGRLARELTAARSELGEARARVAALEAQRSEVRSQVKALSAQAGALAGSLAELEATVGGDHPDAGDAQPMRSEPAASE